MASSRSTLIPFLKHLEESFALPLLDAVTVTHTFRREMDARLAGRASSLKMIPSYIGKPTGAEKGTYIALDLGGTNFRIIELELLGGGVTRTGRVMQCALDRRCMHGTADAFFGFLADRVSRFLRESPAGRHALGFTFSFPLKQSAIASGKLIAWTKGFAVSGVVGRDVVPLLEMALRRRGVTQATVVALVNDTVGTLVAQSYGDRSCDVGVIIGTGTNACYVERRELVRKRAAIPAKDGGMIVNIEWGNFNKMRRTPYDERLDRLSENPGDQLLEKMVSGRYMGELARLLLLDLADRGFLFGGKVPPILKMRDRLKSEYLSHIEADRSADLVAAGETMKRYGLPAADFEDRMLVRKVCGLVSLRAARLAAAAIAAVVTKIDPDLHRRHTIAIDGSVYEKHPGFARNLNAALAEILKGRAGMVRTVLSKDGSGRGAAIVAAIAAAG